ncbi:ABC transporter permease [Planosporangium flavigriseum]|uniref:Ribose ABC transporter permease n=1 Tax=Planosporangium flavigriseum TaxID=373681 RepID=A0A8J3LTL6_9ACTN|nr:ABC transporter permease [Planosporangium flavigriseum]NJC65275.1 ABC transporter permease [Planosporangium flavigriseum]GIG73371.1 ribose ABC transporter permease [Planosporangium flavigriseum]
MKMNSSVSVSPRDSIAVDDETPTPSTKRVLNAGSVGRVLTKYAPLLVLAALLVIGTIVHPGLWAVDNIRNILTQNAAVALVSFGMTLVIIAGVFDLSVGAIFAAGAVAFASLSNVFDLTSSALLAIGIGLLAGAFNGVIVTKFRVNSFIGTIATAAIISGLVYVACDSAPVQSDAVGFDTLGLGGIAGVPWSILIMLAVFVVLASVLNRTILGRYVFASGGNAEAARLTGVPVAAVQIFCLVVVGGLSALAGALTASQLGVGQPTLGANIALDSFAIVVIGGTSVYGGRGALWRTATGVLILAVLTNIFNAMAWDTTRQSVAKGAVLLLAVALDAARNARR